MIVLFIFIITSAFVSWIDAKHAVIPDKIIFPALTLLLIIKWMDGNLHATDFIAVVIVLIVFTIPIIFKMNFGGGDLRFGAFCALFIGLVPLGYFIVSSGIMHLIIMGALRKREFGFAPAMSIAALVAYGVSHA